MKRKILSGLIFALVIVVLLTLAASAESQRAADEAKPVWNIKSIDGTESISYDFFDGLTRANDGDVLTLMVDYIELDTVFTLKTGKSFTLDLGDSKIVYPNNTITTPVLIIQGKTQVKMLADGAQIYLQDNVRSFISISDSTLDVVGTGEGLRIMAPDAVDAGGGATVTLDNVHFMKNSGNMMGLLCSRSTSKVVARNSTFVSRAGGNAVYSCASGQMSLYNCQVISLDNTSAAQISDSATLYAENTVFSCQVKNQNNGFTAGDGCYIPKGVTFTPASGTTAIPVSILASLEVEKFVAPSSYETVSAADCNIANYVTAGMNPSRLTDSPTDGSVWRVENGEKCYYTDYFYYPLLSSEEGDRLTLLRDVTLTHFMNTEVKAESIDFGTHSLCAALPDGLTYTAPITLLDTAASGDFTLASGGKIDLPVLLLSTDRPTVLNLDGASITVTSLATVTAKNLTVSGGYIKTKETALMAVGQGDVVIISSTVVSDTVAVNSGKDTLVRDSVVASLGDFETVRAFRTLSFDGNCYIFGTAIAEKITADGEVYFNTPPVADLDFLLKPLAEPVICDDLPELIFTHRVSKLEGEIKYYFTMSTYPTLNVMVPRYLYEFEVFTLISVDGIVYTPTYAHASEMTLNGEEYYSFAYPYIYASDTAEEGKIRLSLCGLDFEYDFTVRDLMLKNFREISNTTVKCVIATYLEYALNAANDESYSVLREELYPFVASPTVPVPTAPTLIKSVFFDTERGVISLYPTDGVKLESAVIKWGNSTVTVNSKNGVIHLPYLRLDPSVPFNIRFINGDERGTCELGILSLYATVRGSTGRSTAMLESYLRYLIFISEL